MEKNEIKNLQTLEVIIGRVITGGARKSVNIVLTDEQRSALEAAHAVALDLLSVNGTAPKGQLYREKLEQKRTARLAREAARDVVRAQERLEREAAKAAKEAAKDAERAAMHEAKMEAERLKAEALEAIKANQLAAKLALREQVEKARKEAMAKALANLEAVKPAITLEDATSAIRATKTGIGSVKTPKRSAPVPA